MTKKSRESGSFVLLGLSFENADVLFDEQEKTLYRKGGNARDHRNEC